MTMPNRSTANTKAEHIVDHNLLADLYTAIGGVAGWNAYKASLAHLIPPEPFDRFDGTALSASWTKVDASGGAARMTVSVSGGALNLANAGGDATQEIHAVMYPITAMAVGDAFVVKSTLGSATRQIGGILLHDGLVHGGTGRGILARRLENGNQNMSEVTGYISGTENTNVATTANYQRLSKQASNSWRLDVSTDGISWTNGFSSYTLAFTPTHVGLVSSSWGTSTTSTITYFDIARTSGII